VVGNVPRARLSWLICTHAEFDRLAGAPRPGAWSPPLLIWVSTAYTLAWPWSRSGIFS